MHPDERANAWKCTVGEGLFGIGMGMVAAVTVLPLLLRYLGAGEVMLGISFGIATAGWGLAQPIGLLLFGNRRGTKSFLVPWSFVFAVPTYLAMGLAVLLLGPTRPRLCSVLVLALFGTRVLGAGLAIAFWYDWHATLFSQGIRGRAIGMMAAASALGVSGAAAVAGLVRQRMQFPVNYSLLFFAATLFFMLGLFSFASVNEPDEARAPTPQLKLRDLLVRFGQSLGDTNFRNYLIGRIILTMGGGAAGFYAVYFKSPEGGGLSESTVITLGMFLTLPQAVFSYLLGRVGDHTGHKLGITVGAVGQLGSLLVAYCFTGLWACICCFALLGVAWASSWVSNANMLFETCPHDSRVAHVTLSNMVLSPCVLMVPLATGWVMGMASVGTRGGLGLAIIPTVLGVLWLVFVVKEPRSIEIARRALRARQNGENGTAATG